MIRVDYAGPGGVCHGMTMIGLHPIGFEWERDACATRAAARHLTVRCNLATYRPRHEPGTVTGYWASPPCQTFSASGNGEGRRQLDRLADVIHDGAWGDASLFDDKTRHVIDSARTACELAPEWVCMEQVPSVLPLWRALAYRLEQQGYSTWTGVLNSADYGVPQTRKRAILIASRSRTVSCPPPTHAKDPVPSLFGELAPWVSMAEALGWGYDHRVAPTVTDGGPGGGARKALQAWVVRTGSNSMVTGRTGSKAGDGDVQPYERPVTEPAPVLDRKAGSAWTFHMPAAHDAANWMWERPATTVCGDPRLWPPGHKVNSADRERIGREEADARYGDRAGTNARHLTVEEALILQSFPADYPVQGSKTSKFAQIGNAVPPLMAAHIVAAAAGLPAPDPTNRP